MRKAAPQPVIYYAPDGDLAWCPGTDSRRIHGKRYQEPREPVRRENANRYPDDGLKPLAEKERRRRDRPAEADAGKDGVVEAVGEVEPEEPVIDEPQRKENQEPLHYPPEYLPVRKALRPLARKGERPARAGEEDESREHEVYDVEPRPINMLHLRGHRRAEVVVHGRAGPHEKPVNARDPHHVEPAQRVYRKNPLPFILQLDPPGLTFACMIAQQHGQKRLKYRFAIFLPF